MNPLQTALLTFVAPLVAGYAGRRALQAADRSVDPLLRISAYQKHVVNLVLTPISAALSLWSLDVSQVKLAALPVIGGTYHAVGTLIALAIAWYMGMPNKQRGVFVMAGMNSNLGLIGGLLCFQFFGETGYALSSFFRILEMPIYFLIGFPVASAIGAGRRMTVRGTFRQVGTDPAVLLPMLGIVVGLVLSLAGIPRPEWLGMVNALLIPLTTVNLAFAVGVTLRAGSVTEHARACGAMVALKFAALPALVWGLGRLAGLDTVDGGLPFKVALLLSFMPVGFTAVVTATMFNLDEELANALWLSNNALVLTLVPVLMPLLL